MLRFIMGADLVSESSKWFGFDKIASLAPPIVLGRVGVEYEGAPPCVLPALSSTEIRAKLAHRDPGAVEAVVPKRVLEYIAEHGLYGES
jgi:nicotinate-nucleotide adenylyltransferase